MNSPTQRRDGANWLELRGGSAAALDVAGLALFGGATAWMWWISTLSGGSAGPGVTLLAVCGLTLLIARGMGSHARLLVPGAALLVTVVLAARSETGVLDTAPLSGPLGYINAAGALYVQAAIAGLMLAAGRGPLVVRMLGGVGAGVFAALPFITDAVAAAWLVVVLPGIALLCGAMASPRAARTAVALCGSLFVGSLAVTIWLGSTYSPGQQPSFLQRASLEVVDPDRQLFWHEAFDIMRRHPATGVGPGRYQVVSPVARSDPDDRWAHHEFLQRGAEGGVIGFALLVLIFLWGFSRLWIVGTPDVVTALGAASLAALGIHASIDYVMHFPAIPIVTAALVATGMTGGQNRWRGAGYTYPEGAISGRREPGGVDQEVESVT